MGARLLPDAPLTVAQARRAGWSGEELRAAVRGGLLRRLCHGVYVGSHVEDTLRTRARAQGLRLGPTAALSHGTAAALLGSSLDVDPASPAVGDRAAGLRCRHRRRPAPAAAHARAGGRHPV